MHAISSTGPNSGPNPGPNPGRTAAPLGARRTWLAGALMAGALVFGPAGCGDNMSTPMPDAGPDAAEPPALVEVQLLAFNDFHGHLENGGGVQVGTMPDGTREYVEAGGAMYFARYLDDLRATQPNTVVVSAGDLIGGSPLLSALFHDEPTIEAMNLMGLEINAVGNHEFDEGSAELLRMQNGGCHPEDEGCQAETSFEGAAFTFLAANVVEEASSETLFPAYEIRAFDGVQVAFIGMTLEGTPEIVTPLGVAGLQFRDEIETVNALVPELQDQGVRAIVVVVHEGGYQGGLYDECDGVSGPIVDIVNGVDDEVDVFITGHTHQAYNCVIDNKLVTSAKSFGRLITDIDLQIDPDTGDVAEVAAENVIVTRDVAGMVDVQELIGVYADEVASLRDEVIGSVTEALTRPDLELVPSGESTLGNLIADAQLAATAAVDLGDADVAFMNPGGIRADLAAGDVTYGQAFEVQPFSNSLVTMTLTGAQIDTLLEQQWTDSSTRILQVSEGFAYTWQASAAIGEKVDISTITLGGQPIEATGTYRVTVNSFMASGGDGFTVLVDGTDRLGGAVDLDALEAYFEANNPVAPTALDRITRID